MLSDDELRKFKANRISDISEMFDFHSNCIRAYPLKHSGLNLIAIDGLNIFAANLVLVPVNKDPRIVFLRTMSSRLECDAHIGILGLEGEKPTDFFGHLAASNTCLRTRVGLFNGSFYSSDVPEHLLFTDIEPAFWSLALPDDDNHKIDYLVEADSLSLYVSPLPGRREKLLDIIDKPIQNKVEWLTAVTDNYKMAVTTYHDGGHIEIFSQHDFNEEVLLEVLKAAEESILSSDWYAEHRGHLVWDGEDYHCLLAG